MDEPAGSFPGGRSYAFRGFEITAGGCSTLRFSPNEQTREGSKRESSEFPHLAKNERDMGHPQLWLGESLRSVDSTSDLSSLPMSRERPGCILNNR